jgi:hypothetical protein
MFYAGDTKCIRNIKEISKRAVILCAYHILSFKTIEIYPQELPRWSKEGNFLKYSNSKKSRSGWPWCWFRSVMILQYMDLLGFSNRHRMTWLLHASHLGSSLEEGEMLKSAVPASFLVNQSFLRINILPLHLAGYHWGPICQDWDYMATLCSRKDWKKRGKWALICQARCCRTK